MPVRARDLRVAIKDMGFERGTVHTLELALEEVSSLRLDLRNITELVSLCINQIEIMVRFGDATKTMLEELKRRANQDGSDE